MILYPAIDLKDGACVRLVRGEMASATVFNDDVQPFEAGVRELQRLRRRIDVEDGGARHLAAH